jgi:hypothetical protein
MDKKEFYRFAKDYGFVDMFGGIDFIYKANNGVWVPIQVKTTATGADLSDFENGL